MHISPHKSHLSYPVYAAPLFLLHVIDLSAVDVPANEVRVAGSVAQLARPPGCRLYLSTCDSDLSRRYAAVASCKAALSRIFPKVACTPWRSTSSTSSPSRNTGGKSVQSGLGPFTGSY